jgi:mycothione reductase
MSISLPAPTVFIGFHTFLHIGKLTVSGMKEYDLIVIGTGSAMDIVNVAIQKNPHMKVAVIDKDEPGGICLTRGCIPSKILLYPAELVRTIERAWEFSIDVEVKKIDFGRVMERMRTIIHTEINMIREGLSHSKNLDYYHDTAEFTAPYTLKVGNDIITSKMIILCTGSKPSIPTIKGLENLGYHTSDTILKMNRLPKSIAIIGGGYIAAEYGHFFSAMGSKVTVIGRNPQFLPEEESEVSALAKKELQKHMEIITNHEVREAGKTSAGEKKLVAVNRENGQTIEVTAEEILVASGRAPNKNILHPERGGIKTDEEGWITVNEYLETSQPNVWALGDADGKYPFKHVANYEAQVVYYNAILKNKLKVDYHAVPHAVFTYPEIASVGLREKEAIEKYGKDGVLIGIHRYEDTAKGEAMNVKDCFVKVIVEKENMKILGAHIIGPYASVLIQEIINLMYTPEQSALPIIRGMHIHPALSEVVQKVFDSLMPPEMYHHVIEEHYELPIK